MTRDKLGPVALALALAVACGGGSASRGGATAAQEGDGAAHVARMDPCALVTKDEIRKKIEANQEPSHLARLNSGGAVWSITTESIAHGESRDCLIKWEVTANGEMRQRGDFYVTVATGEWFKTNLEDMQRTKQPVAIPGIGDEAYFIGGTSRSPYARVGDLAIGVENSVGQPAVDLLRAAVARVH